MTLTHKLELYIKYGDAIYIWMATIHHLIIWKLRIFRTLLFYNYAPIFVLLEFTTVVFVLCLFLLIYYYLFIYIFILSYKSFISPDLYEFIVAYLFSSFCEIWILNGQRKLCSFKADVWTLDQFTLELCETIENNFNNLV